jgi:hypothetical protein
MDGIKLNYRTPKGRGFYLSQNYKLKININKRWRKCMTAKDVYLKLWLNVQKVG